MRLDVGIDPGNESAGVAVFVDGQYAFSSTVHPRRWPTNFPVWDYDKIRLWVEVPQNGTHQSRGGVHWAAGMMEAHLSWTWKPIKKKDVRKVFPRQWRAAFPPPRQGESYKEYAIRYVYQTYEEECDTHDRAEAVMIAKYGSQLSL